MANIILSRVKSLIKSIKSDIKSLWFVRVIELSDIAHSAYQNSLRIKSIPNAIKTELRNGIRELFFIRVMEEMDQAQAKFDHILQIRRKDGSA